MAGTKRFDREATLDEAMQLFWQRGYAATSIRDLVERTGVNRQSLYDTFGDKHDLFMAALERYRSIGEAQFRDLLTGTDPIRERFARFFHFYLDDSAADDRRRGCFLANSTVELAPHDPDTARLLGLNLERSEDLFEQVLTEAKDRGELAPNSDPRQLARFLYASLTGLRVTGKADRNRDRLHDIVEVTLSVLR